MANDERGDARVMSGTRILLATDFDGTVAPIRDHPDEVKLDPNAEASLRRLADVDGVTIAFLSGRDLEDLWSRTREVRAYRSGSHGREIAAPDGAIVRSLTSASLTLDSSLVETGVTEGFRFER